MIPKKITLNVKQSLSFCNTGYSVVIGFLCLLIILSVSCTDFVTVDLPESQLVSEAVFEDTATATSAMAHIYAQMRDNGLVSGNPGGLNELIGYYADEQDYLGSNTDPVEFYSHILSETNLFVGNWWNSTYNLIYAANAIIIGIENSVSLNPKDKNQLKGEALFIRAYLHMLLTELYGDIPYVDSPNYIKNTTISRMNRAEVYEHIIADLTLAATLLPDVDISGERLRPYSAVANALLARAYLYNEQWDAAENTASIVINQQTGGYQWEPDLTKVFLKEALGTLWQFKPAFEGQNALEGYTFILTSTPPFTSALSNSLLNAFEVGDQRKMLWIKSITDGIDTWYYPFKYQYSTKTGSDFQYSVLFRLSEQFLIRAEARVHLASIGGAQDDLNRVRNRAGLPNTTAANKNDLLEAILQERQVELFTEQGHRWFDLKRTGRASEILAPIKPGWEDTDAVLPIPQAELLINPNLLPQNPGY